MTVERVVAGVTIAVSLVVIVSALTWDWPEEWAWAVVIALLGVRLWLAWRHRGR